MAVWESQPGMTESRPEVAFASPPPCLPACSSEAAQGRGRCAAARATLPHRAQCQ